MPDRTLLHEALTGSVIGASYEVYNTLGYGFFESVYRRSLLLELRARGHAVFTEVTVRVAFGPEPTFYRPICERSKSEARPFGR